MEGNSSHRPFQAYPAQPILRSNLVHASEHAIPSLDELLALQRELLALQNASTNRAQKANLDISTFEGMYRKAKEKEKMLKSKIKIKDKDRERTRDGDSETQKERGPVVKIKREYSGTPERDDGSVGPSSRPQQNGRGRPTNASAVKAAFKAASQGPNMPTQPKVKPKNKRKRLDDDDDDMESIGNDLMPPPSQRPRPSPHPHPSHPSSAPAAPPKLKVPAMKPSLSSSSLNGAATPHPPSAVPPPPSIATDWNLPPKPIFPVKPVGATYGGFTYTKTPNDPKDVMDDFSDRKAPPNQTPVHTFWKEVESWMKPVGEEDVAWLEFDADDVEPFLIPALGRHYTEVWEEEDRQAAILAAEVAQSWPRGYSLDRTYAPVDEPPLSAASTNGFGPESSVGDNSPLKTKGREGDGTSLAGGGEGGSSSGLPPPVLSGMNQAITGWDPRTVTESDLLKEDKSVGPITERIMGALLLEEPHGHHKGKDDDATSGLTGAGPKVPAPGSKAAAAGNTINTAGELEARIRAELRALGLLGEEEPVFSPPMDDDITSALRRCQSLLQEQRSINIQRKNRLLSIARDRLAYQDYQNTLDSLEKSITAGYTKMLKAAAKAAPKKGKKDKDKPGVPGGTTVAEGDPGVGTGYGGQVVLNPPDSLLEKVRLRDRWVSVFGKAMDEWERREPGRLTGLPERSIYEGLQGDGGGEASLKDNDGAGKMDVDSGDPRRLLSVGPANGSGSQRSSSAFPNGA
ncbi:Transcriptional regulator [Tulasnella sp. 417]|nr:Transcriptional regulator [Tulasnella sp. 417]